MLTYNRLLSIFFLSAIGVFSVCAQSGTTSPYTRYGYGKIAERACEQSLGMGGIGYGLRTYGQINPLNPASYSKVDSLTFLFNFGLTAGMSWMSNDSLNVRDYTGNISYLTMQFRLMKGLGMSLGIRPYSYVGYRYGNSYTIGDTYYNESGQGSGGLTQIYGGLGYELIKRRLSVGANFGYTFGNISRTTDLEFPEMVSSSVGSQLKAYSVRATESIDAHDLFFETGIQYTQPIGKKDELTLGVVFSPKQLFTSDNNINIVTSEPDTIKNITSDQKQYMPMSVGVGLGYVKNHRLTLGADVSYQAWSDVPNPDGISGFKDKIKYAAGVEYVPNPFAQKGFFKRTRYRAGVYYTDSYIHFATVPLPLENTDISEYGATIGLGMPFRPFRGRESILNFSAEYIKIVPGKSNMINEQYFRLTLGISFCETWFHKRKFD